MERRSFYFLYVNLNSLAELALRLEAAKVLANLPDPGPVEALSEEEIDARVMASFENLDLSALEGIGVASPDDKPLDLDALSMEPPPDLAEMEQAGEGDEEIDVERYMARAYGYEELLRERIDSHYRRADLPAMDAALGQLPDRLTALTGPLSAADMTEWLKLYEEEHEVLTDLTVRIRQLDMSAG